MNTLVVATESQFSDIDYDNIIRLKEFVFLQVPYVDEAVLS
jgi:hypothetical protein